MGRKARDVCNAESVNEATAEAASILSGDLAVVSAMMRANLEAANAAGDEDTQERLFEDAMRLVDAAARLAEALSRVKGERRQTISVERKGANTETASKTAAIAPQFAPNKRAQAW
jgi:hypothetical protein